jgi:adenylyl- and sulfurtransferase ThiI
MPSPSFFSKEANIMEGVVVVRTGGEIGIKSKPVRRMYENLVLKTIRGILKDEGISFSRIWRTAGRIYINTEEGERAARRVAKVFGVSSTSPGVSASSELENIVRTGTEIAQKSLRLGTFAVRCRRTGSHPYSSVQVAALLGESIRGLGKNLKVDLTNPQQMINVEIRDELAIIYVLSIRGPDGFPVGTQEMLLGIVDETVDSVLASWCMMKRGAQLKALVIEGREGLSNSLLINLRTIAGWMPGNRIRAVVAPINERDVSRLRPLQLQLAIYAAKSKGIGGVVSGLQPSLREIRKITRPQVSVLLPLIAMDDRLLERWSDMVGIDLSVSARYEKKTLLDQEFSNTELEEILSASKEITVRANRP